MEKASPTAARDRVRETEERMADLKGRWPAHSVPPSMWLELEALEEELEEAKKAERTDAP